MVVVLCEFDLDVGELSWCFVECVEWFEFLVFDSFGGGFGYEYW